MWFYLFVFYFINLLSIRTRNLNYVSSLGVMFDFHNYFILNFQNSFFVNETTPHKVIKHVLSKYTCLNFNYLKPCKYKWLLLNLNCWKYLIKNINYEIPNLNMLDIWVHTNVHICIPFDIPIGLSIIIQSMVVFFLEA